MMKVVVFGPKFWKKLAIQYFPKLAVIDYSGSFGTGTHKEDKCLFTSGSRLHCIVAEAHTDEDDGKNGESHELDGISTRALSG